MNNQDDKVKAQYQTLAQQLIAGTLTIDQFVAQQAALHAQLESRADYDGLITYFFNIQGFTKSLDKYLMILKRINLTGSLLALDVDNFKRFNDTKGHPAGDELLKLYAQIITRESRESDLKGRLGGDEFSMFLVGSGTQGAQIVAERIRLGIVASVKQLFPDLGWEQTVSIGIAEYHPQDSVKSLREKADQALYKAKETRNTTVIYPKS